MRPKLSNRGVLSWAALAVVLVLAVWIGAGDRFGGILSGSTGEGGGGASSLSEGGDGGSDSDEGDGPAQLSDALLAAADLSDLGGWAELELEASSISSDFCGDKFTPGRDPQETVRTALREEANGESAGHRLLAYESEQAANAVFNSFNGLKGRCKKWKQTKERSEPDGPVKGPRGPQTQVQEWDIEDLAGFPTLGDETVALSLKTIVKGTDEEGNEVDNELVSHLVLMRRGIVINVLNYSRPEAGTVQATTLELAQRADTKLVGFLAG